MRISDWSSDVCSSDLVVGRHLDVHAVARENANAVLAHLAGRMGQHFMVVVELHAEHRVGQQLDNGTLEFQQIFLGHLSFLSNPPSRFIAPARFVSLAIPVLGFPLRSTSFDGSDRTSVVWGKRWPVSVTLVGRRI